MLDGPSLCCGVCKFKKCTGARWTMHPRLSSMLHSIVRDKGSPNLRGYRNSHSPLTRTPWAQQALGRGKDTGSVRGWEKEGSGNGTSRWRTGTIQIQHGKSVAGSVGRRTSCRRKEELTLMPASPKPLLPMLESPHHLGAPPWLL